jgi:hypothetical protein
MFDINEIHKWKLIPYEKFTINYHKEKEQIISSLHSKVGRKLSYTEKANTLYYKEYEGVLTDKEFKIRRTMKIGYNGFKPNIIGKFSDTESKIDIIIRPDKLLMILLGLVVGLQLTLLFSNTGLSHNNFDWSDLVIASIIYLITIISFNIDRSLVKKDLILIIKGENVAE